jgi:hypothetical protein
MRQIKLIGVDNHYVIGDGHDVCEDYTWSGMILGKYPCVILSDGCSSSDDTDIGARIMVRSMKETLENSLTFPLNYDSVMMEFRSYYKSMARALFLPDPALDATILVAVIMEGVIHTIQYGDGYIVHKQPNKTVMDYYQYPFNAPFYHHYTAKYDYEQRYLERFEHDEDGKNAHIVMGYNGGVGYMSVFDHVKVSQDHHKVYYIDQSDLGLHTISLLSDGVDTFFQGNDRIELNTVLDDILSFKNTTGEFVKRKLKMYLHKNAKNNIQHYDDISLATIAFEIVEVEDGSIS